MCTQADPVVVKEKIDHPAMLGSCHPCALLLDMAEGNAAVHLGGRNCWCPADIDTIGVLQFDAASRLRIFVSLVCAW